MGRNIKIIITSLVSVSLLIGGLAIAWPPTFGVPYGEAKLWQRIFSEEPHYELSETTKGVILPHHLIAGLEMNKFYKALSKVKAPKTFVIIGPNHYESGNQNIYTGNLQYQTTDSGILTTNSDLVNKLTKNSPAKKAQAIFEQEHAIYAHANFIKKYFPESQILPIMIKWETPQTEVEELAKQLLKLNSEDTFYIASVDFSHYIPHLIADFHDQKSQQALLSLDLTEIPNIEVDSWPSLFTLVSLMKEINANNSVLHNHTNSQDFFQSTLEVTTSHHFISFNQDPKKQITPTISYLFFGDTIFDRGVLTEKNNNPNWFKDFAGLEDRLLWGADFQVLNLEGPITPSSDPQQKEVVFNQEQSSTETFLTQYNFNQINLANNHTLDYFEQGYQDTISLLDKNKIGWSGSYQNQNICNQTEKNTLTISFCGFNDVGEILNIENAVETIKEANINSDQVIINIHWGIEYQTKPTNRQKEIAYKLIDAGADIIIGHHPHVIQTLETYKGKPIFYSLGNFLFDQASPKETQTGLAVGANISQEEIRLYLFPFHTNNGNPIWFNEAEREDFYRNYAPEALSSYPKGIL